MNNRRNGRIGRGLSATLMAIVLTITMIFVYAFPMEVMASEELSNVEIVITFNTDVDPLDVTIPLDEGTAAGMIPDGALPEEWADFYWADDADENAEALSTEALYGMIFSESASFTAVAKNKDSDENKDGDDKDLQKKDIDTDKIKDKGDKAAIKKVTGNKGNAVESNITNWRKTPEANKMTYGDARSDNRIFTWNWETINAGMPNNVLSPNNVWDLTSNNHDGLKYVDNTSTTLFNAASWANGAGGQSTMRRFQGTFVMPEGLSSVDNFYIDSVRAPGSIAINDLMYVFMYPADYRMTNENYLEQFAFWGGDVNEAIPNGDFHGQPRVTSAQEDKYRPASAVKDTELSAETLYHTDGRFIIAGAGTTSLNEAIRIASQKSDVRTWTIDVITADYFDGGGMDELYIAASKNQENVALTVNYWKLDENGENPTPAYKNGKASKVINITSANVGSEYVLNDEQLNANRPEDYSNGIQQGGEIIESGINNIIDVYYTPEGVEIKTKEISYTIDYYKEGALDKSLTQTVKKVVWFNADDSLDVDETIINTTDAFGANYTYKNTTPNIVPATIENKGVIDVYYVAKKTTPVVPETPAPPVTPGTTKTPETTVTTVTTTPTVPAIVQAIAPLVAPLFGENAEDLMDILESNVPLVNNEVPAETTAAWALLNLMLTILIGLIMVALFVTYLVKREDRYEDDPDMDETVNKKLGFRLISIIVAAVAIIVFMITEDMSLPMQWTDSYTIWMALILVVQLVVTFFARKKYTEEEINPENV